MTGLAATRKTASVYEWHLVLPAICAASDVSTLPDLSEFRGLILYADGRRPGSVARAGSTPTRIPSIHGHSISRLAGVAIWSGIRGSGRFPNTPKAPWGGWLRGVSLRRF